MKRILAILFVIMLLSSFMVTAVPAMAATAPTATTVAASSIMSTGATLNGTVNADNADSTVTFIYSSTDPTLATGTTVGASPSPVTGTTVTPVSAAITGLTAGTEYYFRVIAINSVDTTNGDILHFTTLAAPVVQSPVDLGKAGNFAILSYAGITDDSPPSVITGNVGAYPISGTGIALTGSEVTGTIYASDDAGPAGAVVDPTLLDTAMGNLGTAYTDANSRATTVLDAGSAGEIGGLVLPPGVYTFDGASINVTISTNLTLSGGASGVWIFQIPGTFTVATDAQVILGGDAQAENIFWAVAGATTLHATSVVNGTILDHTSIAMQDHATLNGRALAATESVTLLTNTVTLAPPTITGISPAVGSTLGSTTVTITGTHFTGATQVDFGTNPGAITSVTATSITAVSPSGTGTADVTVTTPSGTSATSAADEFTYANAPTVTGIAPTYGPLAGSTSVAITGTNFTGVTEVDFGENEATFVDNTDTLITATSPAGTGIVDVTVITPGGTSVTSSADLFTYMPAPTVTGINPTSGPGVGGTSVVITGTSFTGATAVTFGETPATSFAPDNDDQLTAVSPEGTGVVDVTVTAPGGTSATGAADEFTYVPAPTVTGIVPTGGRTTGGTAITITGTGFISGATVTIDNNDAVGVWVSATSMTATTPAGTAGTQSVVVTNPDGQSGSGTFLYDDSAPVALIYKLHPRDVLISENPTVEVNDEGRDDVTPYLNGPDVIRGRAWDNGGGTVTGIQLTITDDNTDATFVYNVDNTDIHVYTNYVGWSYTLDSDNTDLVYDNSDHNYDGDTYTITAIAQDEAGNLSDPTLTQPPAYRSFILDTTPPAISFADIYNNVVSRYITGEATDATSGMANWGAVYGELNDAESHHQYGSVEGLHDIHWLYDSFFENDAYWDWGGTYTLTIYAEDKAGNWGYKTSPSFTYEELNVDDFMTLKEGWNFISFPATLADNTDSVAEIFAAQGVPATAVYAYDPSSGWTWLNSDSADTQFSPLNGYWVKVDIYRTKFGTGYDYVDSKGRKIDSLQIGFSYTGLPAPGNGATLPSKEITGNAWNAIGGSFSTTVQDYEFSGGQPTLEDNVDYQLVSIKDDWCMLYSWSRDNQDWSPIVINDPTSLEGQIMTPGQGYWICISKDTNDIYFATSLGIDVKHHGP